MAFSFPIIWFQYTPIPTKIPSLCRMDPLIQIGLSDCFVESGLSQKPTGPAGKTQAERRDDQHLKGKRNGEVIRKIGKEIDNTGHPPFAGDHDGK